MQGSVMLVNQGMMMILRKEFVDLLVGIGLLLMWLKSVSLTLILILE